MAFLSVRLPDEVRARVKAIAAARGEKVQDLVGHLIVRFLDEAERRPPGLAEVVRQLRAAEPRVRARGVSALWVFGSVARGDARPDSDVDLLVDFAPGARPSLLTLSAMREDLAEALGRPVDLGERAALKPRMAAAAASEMVRVF
jgi:predicted nucleotidyltransferase